MKKYFTNLFIVVLAVLVAYSIAWLLRINYFVWTLLKGKYYGYVSLFLPLLGAWWLLYFAVRSSRCKQFMVDSMSGVVGGYLSGLLAFLFLPIYGAHAAERIFTAHDLDRMLFLSPVIALSWLVGLMSGWVVWGLKRSRFATLDRDAFAP